MIVIGLLLLIILVIACLCLGGQDQRKINKRLKEEAKEAERQAKMQAKQRAKEVKMSKKSAPVDVFKEAATSEEIQQGKTIEAQNADFGSVNNANVYSNAMNRANEEKDDFFSEPAKSNSVFDFDAKEQNNITSDVENSNLVEDLYNEKNENKDVEDFGFIVDNDEEDSGILNYNQPKEDDISKVQLEDLFNDDAQQNLNEVEEPVVNSFEQPINDTYEEPKTNIFDEPIADTINETKTNMVEEPVVDEVEEPIKNTAEEISSKGVFDVPVVPPRNDFFEPEEISEPVKIETKKEETSNPVFEFEKYENLNDDIGYLNGDPEEIEHPIVEEKPKVEKKNEDTVGINMINADGIEFNADLFGDLNGSEEDTKVEEKVEETSKGTKKTTKKTTVKKTTTRTTKKKSDE